MADTDPDLAAWTRRLRHETPIDPSLADLDAIDREALDSSVGFAAEHARRYVASGGTDDGWDGLRPIVIVYATGRTSGRTRRVPLLCFEVGDEHYVIGSKGGDTSHPEWYLNVVANPAVDVRIGERVHAATARTLDGDERAAVWSKLIATHPRYADYQLLTTRLIPIVHLAGINEIGR